MAVEQGRTWQGKVKRLYCEGASTQVTLADVASGAEVNTGTDHNYLHLRLDHANYSSIFSLLVTSGANKLPISIRMADEDAARISYVFFDFPS